MLRRLLCPLTMIRELNRHRPSSWIATVLPVNILIDAWLGISAGDHNSENFGINLILTLMGTLLTIHMAIALDSTLLLYYKGVGHGRLRNKYKEGL